MIQKITKAYMILIFVFGFILVAGSIKSTMNPDEKVYTPGKYIALYDPENKVFMDVDGPASSSSFYGRQLQARSFSYPLTQCQ